MSLPAKLILGAHIFAVAGLLAAPLLALFNRVAVPLSRQRALVLVILALATGLQNFTAIAGEIVKGSGYHMWFGIKVLLGLHIMAINLVASDPAKDDAKRVRLLQGAGISGFLVIVLAVYLSYLRGH